MPAIGFCCACPHLLDARSCLMPRKLKHAVASAWILGIIFILLGIPAFAESPRVEEVLGVLGMNKGQIDELAQGQPVAYALSEGSADELAVGLVWYLPVSLDKVAGQLRLEDPDLLDVDVTAHGLLMEHSGAGSLAPVVLSQEAAEALLDAEPGDEFNLSAQGDRQAQNVQADAQADAPKGHRRRRRRALPGDSVTTL